MAAEEEEEEVEEGSTVDDAGTKLVSHTVTFRRLAQSMSLALLSLVATVLTGKQR